MKTADYLDRCKKKLEISSTYALAKAFGIEERRLREHYEGSGKSEFVYFKIAQVLDLDPAYVIADIKSETEKDEVRREFFKSFVGLAKQSIKMLMLVVFINLSQGVFNDRGTVFLRRRYFV